MVSLNMGLTDEQMESMDEFEKVIISLLREKINEGENTAILCGCMIRAAGSIVKYKFGLSDQQTQRIVSKTVDAFTMSAVQEIEG